MCTDAMSSKEFLCDYNPGLSLRTVILLFVPRNMARAERDGMEESCDSRDEDWQRSALSRVLSRVVEGLEPLSLVESLRSQGDVVVEELFDALTEEGLLGKEGPSQGRISMV